MKDLQEIIPSGMSVSKRPKAFDEYTEVELDQMLEESFRQVERGEVYAVDEVFNMLFRNNNR